MSLHRIAGTGLPNVYLQNGFSTLSDDGEVSYSYLDLDGLYMSLARAIARRDSALTGAEFKLLRRLLQQSQEEAGAMVGKTNQAIAKWEKGEAPVPRADGNMMRLAWMAKFARRHIGERVCRMVTSASSYAGAYVFSHSHGEWIEEERANALVPIAAEVVVGSETATPTVSALLAVPAAFEFVEMNTLRA